MIYFIRAGVDGPVKIGKSYNSLGRLRSMQCSNHETLTLIRETPGEYNEEQWVHRHFAALRLAREWFRFSPEMLTVEVVGSNALISSHRHILDLWPSDADIARDVNVKPERVRKWRHRRIPSEFWGQLRDAAATRGVTLKIGDFMGVDA